ncbi:hypothetical protein [Agrobacterium rosae]|uniref:hypothetical protein n=1 Tax=Agrobacterium rosae TaxID=1972867 RepID=UPI003A7FFAE3
MVAKNGGNVKLHHFAHRTDEATAECATAGETALYMLGKEIVAHRTGDDDPDNKNRTENEKNIAVACPRLISGIKALNV